MAAPAAATPDLLALLAVGRRSEDKEVADVADDRDRAEGSGVEVNGETRPVEFERGWSIVSFGDRGDTSGPSTANFCCGLVTVELVPLLGLVLLLCVKLVLRTLFGVFGGEGSTVGTASPSNDPSASADT